MQDSTAKRLSALAIAAVVVVALAFPVIASAIGGSPAEEPPYAGYTRKRRQVVYRGRAKRFAWADVARPVTPAPVPVPTDTASVASSILDGLKATYPRYLSGVTVSMGTTPNGYQAVCYYREGRIVVNPNHTASLEEILSHEIWHVIDWRDNGCIDWRESIPPANAADYRG